MRDANYKTSLTYRLARLKQLTGSLFLFFPNFQSKNREEWDEKGERREKSKS